MDTSERAKSKVQKTKLSNTIHGQSTSAVLQKADRLIKSLKAKPKYIPPARKETPYARTSASQATSSKEAVSNTANGSTSSATKSSTVTTSSAKISSGSTGTLMGIQKELAILKEKMTRIETQNKKVLRLLIEIGEKQKETPGYSIENTPHKYELRTALAKAYCVSLTRDVSEEALKSIVVQILQEEARDKGKLLVAVKWARKQLSSFRTEERRKVLGITPFAAYTSLSTQELCKQIMRSMKAPTDFTVESCYLKNLSILRQFARTSTNVSQRGEFFKNFKIWLTESFSEGGDEDGTENTSQAETEDSMQPGSQSSLGHSSAGCSDPDYDDGHGPA